MPIKGKPYKERLELLKAKIKDIPRIQILETQLHEIDFPSLKSEDKINIFKKDYEGTMIRTLHGLYDFNGRSNHLLKVKKFMDAEGTIIGLQELTTKEKVIVPEGTPGSKRYADGTFYKDGEETKTGTLGSFLVKTKSGEEFNVGSGFTKKQREEFFNKKYIGKEITYKYQELSEDGIPRFPTFLRFREDI